MLQISSPGLCQPKEEQQNVVHGMRWTDGFFQTGLVIGDTEQQYKICGFRGGNGLHRLHISRDCDCHTYEADESGYLVIQRQPLMSVITCNRFLQILITATINFHEYQRNMVQSNPGLGKPVQMSGQGNFPQCNHSCPVVPPLWER